MKKLKTLKPRLETLQPRLKMLRTVQPGSIQAFGIDLVSRSSDAREMTEMMNFALAASMAGVAAEVAELFYDSGSNLCVIKPRGRASSMTIDLVQAVADDTLTQYEWDGVVGGKGAA